MSNLFDRIRQNRGETLLESMAAILIFTFASIALLTMLMTAGNLNEKAAQQTQAQAAAMALAEMGEGAAGTGTVRIILHGKTETAVVEVYGQGSGPYAYYLPWEETGE